MYQVGDYIVKASNGVCKVKAIVHPDFVSDKKKLYYLLTPVADENANLYVPIDRGEESARPVMTEKEAKELVKKIPSIDATWINNEREREHNYKDAVQSNDPERLVGIIKLIYGRKKARAEQGKKTTAVDGRYYDTAERLLYSELELAMHKNKDEILAMIRDCCNSE